MWGYKMAKLGRSEKWFSFGGLAFLTPILILDKIYEPIGFVMMIGFFIYPLLMIAFLFPKVFYHLRIDFGNLFTSFLWLLIVLEVNMLASWIIEEHLLTIVYFHLHFMRILHFLFTRQTPAYSAYWTSVGELDKLACRKVSLEDVVFAVLYGMLPIIGIAVYFWIKELGTIIT